MLYPLSYLEHLWTLRCCNKYWPYSLGEDPPLIEIKSIGCKSKYGFLKISEFDIVIIFFKFYSEYCLTYAFYH